MSQKKKIFLIVGIVMLILTILVGIMCWSQIGGKTEDTLRRNRNSKINRLYSELAEKQAFSFRATSNEKNKMYYAKKGKEAYISTTHQNEESKFIMKDGNSYLLMDDEKMYYSYQNNEANVDKILVQLETLKDMQYAEGKEKIENKVYPYEEYRGVTEFLLKNVDTTEKTTKTRFYFNGNQLVYIKTIIGDYQEVLKIDISYQVEDNLFEIPENYQEA